MPVCNAQTSLARDVAEYLEILPDLTGRFELVIVDDGSADDTIEVADELALEYPQIRVARHESTQGRTAAIRTGLSMSRGDFVFLRDPGCQLPLCEMHQLWNATRQHAFVLGRPAAARRTMLSGHGDQSPGGFQMFRRLTGASVVHSLADQAMLRAALVRRGQSWQEIDIRPVAAHGPRPSGLSRSLSRITSRVSLPVRDEKSEARPSAGRPGRPNYLARLKDFAIGE